MEKRYDVPRTIRRLEPRHAATAAVFWDSEQLAYGVVTNVSVTGACIVTDSPLNPGSDVDLKLSFYQQSSLYELGARVVWNRRGGAREEGFEGLQLHGVRFMLSSALQKSRLHTLLESEDFEDVFHPSASEFDVFQEALSSELAELGSKIHKLTGEES